MPRNVRNFWLVARIDGRNTSVETGPRSKDGGFSLVIKQRMEGSVVPGITVEGRVEGSDIILTVADHHGIIRHTHRTRR